MKNRKFKRRLPLTLNHTMTQLQNSQAYQTDIADQYLEQRFNKSLLQTPKP